MNAETIQTLGSALLHFLWQGTALALLLYVLLSFAGNARVRYGVSVCMLCLMALCPIATFAVLSHPAAESAPAAYLPIAASVSNVSVLLSSAASPTPLDWLTSFVWVWCSGVLIFGVRALGGWLVLQRLKRTVQETVSPALLAQCRRLQQRIGVAASVRFAYSDMISAPAVLGWFRPVVLIPLSTIAGLSTEQLEAVIAHELAHIKRYDALVNLFQIVVETVLFYHPAIWWTNRLIRSERENCCDDVAVAVCGNAGEYARALAMLGDARPAWAMAANGGVLKARVARLLGLQKIVHGVPRAGLAVLALLSASCFALAAGAFKQDPPAPPPPPPMPAVAPAPPAPPTGFKPAKAAKPPKPPKPPRVPADAGPPAPPAEPSDPPEPPTDPEPQGSYIDSLASVGLTNLSVDELVALKIQGVTAEYIRAIRATGLKPGIHDLLGMKVQGVTPEFIRAMQSAGLGDLKLHDFVAAKVQGITPQFIEKVRGHGFKDLTLHQLMSLKMAGVF